MNRFKHAALTAITLVGLASSGTASAVIASTVIWNEAPPGAGDLIATAQVTTGSLEASLTNIRGTLKTTSFVGPEFLSEVDVYSIYISNFDSFSARTLSSNPDDTSLFLFDRSGKGIYTHDDNANNLLSTLPTGGPQTNGFYFIAVSVGGFIALDNTGTSMFLEGSSTGVFGPDPDAGKLAGWMQLFQLQNEGGLDYDIEFTGARVAVVPEPTTALMMLLGLGGLLAARTLRRSSQV